MSWYIFATYSNLVEHGSKVPAHILDHSACLIHCKGRIVDPKPPSSINPISCRCQELLAA